MNSLLQYCERLCLPVTRGFAAKFVSIVDEGVVTSVLTSNGETNIHTSSAFTSLGSSELVEGLPKDISVTGSSSNWEFILDLTTAKVRWPGVDWTSEDLSSQRYFIPGADCHNLHGTILDIKTHGKDLVFFMRFTGGAFIGNQKPSSHRVHDYHWHSTLAKINHYYPGFRKTCLTSTPCVRKSTPSNRMSFYRREPNGKMLKGPIIETNALRKGDVGGSYCGSGLGLSFAGFEVFRSSNKMWSKPHN